MTTVFFSSTGKHCSPILPLLSSICYAQFIQSSRPLKKTQYVTLKQLNPLIWIHSIKKWSLKTEQNAFFILLTFSSPAQVLKRWIKKHSKQEASPVTEKLESPSTSSSSSSFSVSVGQLFLTFYRNLLWPIHSVI